MEEKREQPEIYSKRVKAGKRTYFFDVKATRANDYYLTITESRKKFRGDEERDGYFYEKHKIFLYKEDVNKFSEALSETVNHIKTELMPHYDFDEFDNDKRMHEDHSAGNAKQSDGEAAADESSE